MSTLDTSAPPISLQRSSAGISSSEWFGLGLLILANLALALPLAWYLDLRSDEAYSLATVAYEFKAVTYQALNFEHQAPSYFLGLAIWQMIVGDGIFAGRLLSVLFVLLAAVVMMQVSSRYVPRVNPLLPTLVFLFNPLTIYAEVDIRSTAMVLCLSAMILVTFYDACLRDQPRTRARIFYAALVLVAAFTHYYLAWLILANIVVLLLTARWAAVRRLLLDLMVPAVLCLILLPFLPAQIHQKVLQIQDPGAAQVLFWSFKNLDHLLLATDLFEFDSDLVRALVRLAVVAVLVVPVIWAWRAIPGVLRSADREILILTATLLLAYLCLYALFGRNFVQTRYMASALIPVILSLYVLIPKLGSRYPFMPYTAVLLACYCFALACRYTPLIKTEDYSGVAHYLEQQESNGQPVVVFENVHHMVLAHHYDGVNELVALPFAINFDEPWGHERWALKSEAQVAEVFESLPESGDKIWLVVHGQKVVRNVDLNHQYLENYVARNFEQLSERRFPKKLVVRELRRKSG